MLYYVYMKHTKIVCTIGPASRTKTTLQQMMSAGMNVARLNFSHGDYPDHANLIKTIRSTAKAQKKHIALLQDLQGPRIRTGEVPKEGIELSKGDTVVLLSQKEYAEFDHDVVIPVPIQFPKLSKFVKKNGMVTIQDGIIELKVTHVDEGLITCRVVQGGTVFTHKGLNAPGAEIDIPVITKKDKEDLKFGIEQGVDYVALSFVKDEKNIAQLRRLLPKNSGIKIIAKIERAEAVENFDRILDAVDGIMVARGDLGVELGPSEVPLLQKEMILQCIQAAKPVIVATQMLESMTGSPRPTRAEASDVANAIIDHTDAIMLSAESATGKYPVKAVRTMTQIARKVEHSPFDDLPRKVLPQRLENHRAAVAHASVKLAESMDAKAIVLWTDTGETATLLAQLRPQHAKIVVCTNDEQVLRQSALIWGVRSILMKKPKAKSGFIRSLRAQLVKQKIVKKGDQIVIIPGEIGKKQEDLAEIITV